MLNELGYKVIASTGKQDVSDQLLELGAKEVIDRLPVEDDHKSHCIINLASLCRPCWWRRYNYVTKRLNHSGSIAVIGMTAGNTILPCIPSHFKRCKHFRN